MIRSLSFGSFTFD